MNYKFKFSFFQSVEDSTTSATTRPAVISTTTPTPTRGRLIGTTAPTTTIATPRPTPACPWGRFLCATVNVVRQCVTAGCKVNLG